MTDSKFEIRRLSDCPLPDAVGIWNESFKGYFVDLTLTPAGYLKRLQNEEISQPHSLIAYSEGRPVGFLLNGLRNIGGLKVAWNGGTGVNPELRKHGVGQALVHAAIELYAAEGVDRATLEALSNNEPAIALYRKFGYEVVDRLIFLSHDETLNNFPAGSGAKKYLARRAAPADVGELNFYRDSAAWQTQWQSLAWDNGEAVIVSDGNTDIGYALFRKKFSGHEILESIALYQCEAAPDRNDAAEIVNAALEHVYGPLDVECRRTTSNLRRSNEIVLRILQQAGFTTFVEQVQMVKEM